MPSADVVPVPSEYARRAAVSNREHAEPVVLNLEQPIVPIECRSSALEDLEREIAEAEHAIIFTIFRNGSSAAGPLTRSERVSSKTPKSERNRGFSQCHSLLGQNSTSDSFAIGATLCL